MVLSRESVELPGRGFRISRKRPSEFCRAQRRSFGSPEILILTQVSKGRVFYIPWALKFPMGTPLFSTQYKERRAGWALTLPTPPPHPQPLQMKIGMPRLQLFF